ncbi:MAG: amino acid adenylation domain-containing protein [Cyanothece sp. SIO2G6]|nr:amino acid adenylation domain-containing protein [Cyanothece sp. SIO2G6]
MSSPTISTITGFKLSSQQRQIWWRQSALGQVLTTQCRIMLQGNLDLPLLQTALQTVVNHHEILRTTFQSTPGLTLPLQTIQSQGSINWQMIDLATATATEQAVTLANFQAKQRQSVQPAGPSWVEATLFKLSENKHILLLTLPALCADTKTCEILLAQISQCYGGRSLTEEPVQYVQFATWQEQLLTEADEESQAAQTFWQQQLSPSRGPLLPPLRYRDAEPDQFRSNVHRMELATPLAETLLAMDTAVETVLLTSWLVVLWRQTEQSDITLGVTCESRQDEDLVDVCGPFTHTLPLHSQISGAIAFTALLRQVEQNWQELNEWQDYYPSDRPVPWPISFEFIHQPASVSVAGVEFRLEQTWSDAQAPELKLTAIQQDNQLVLEFHYNETVISAGAIAALSNQLQSLLTHMSQQPTASISSFKLTDAADALTPTANATPAHIVSNTCIHHRIEQQVERTPNAVALIYETQQLTYQELNHQANQLAHHLQQLGAGPEVPVAIYLERSLDLLIALLAILKTGATYLPIDIALPSNGVSYRLEDAQAKILVTRQSLLRETAVTTQVVCLDGDRPIIAQHSSANPTSAVMLANLAYIIYTSGSTGQPKGVAVEHRQLLSYVDSAIDRLDLPAAGHYATVSTLAADLGHTMIFPCLCQGGTLHVIAAERVGDAQALVDYTQQHPIDCLKIVPSHLRALLQTPQPEQMLPRQRLVLGGEACSWSLMDQIQQLAPHCRSFNHYGPTETTVGALTHAFRTTAQQTAATVPIGQALTNSQVYLLDSDLQPVPIGIPGEVYIGGDGVTRGYLHRPGLTAARFLPDPFSHQSGGRMYRTGDLARRHPDGNLEFLRRVDLQVKLHGFRIELGEIEAQLAQHPDVQAVSTIVREDDPNNPVLVAYVVPHPAVPHPEKTTETTLDSGEFRLFLRQRLPNYMIPSLFVTLSALPLTPNGKVDRQALPAPERIRPDLSKEYVAPRNPTEEAIAAIWTDVLGLETVGVNDNFFDLGGHSLLATQVLSRLREVFQVELPLHQLFDAHTVAEIAEVVEIALLAEIEAMTDEEVQALMQE